MSEVSKSFQIVTLGCKANAHDSEALERQFLEAGWKMASDQAPDTIVINTCSVTNAADRESERLARKLKEKHPFSRVILTGCAVEAQPGRFRGKPGVDALVPNRLRHELVKSLGEAEPDSEAFAQWSQQRREDRDWQMPELFVPTPESLLARRHTRFFLKVQEGCDRYCTYCIIPYGRGPSRSLPADQIVQAIQKAVDGGVQEVVLTATNLGDYGLESEPESIKKEKGAIGLLRLCQQILKETSLPRLRLSSLDPMELCSEFVDWVVSESRVAPHAHVSVQSVDSKILRKMKRGYTQEEVVACLHRLSHWRGKNGPAWIGLDLITGFPGETLEDFEKGRELLKNLPWTRLHVFPYSERAGTPATRLKDGIVPVGERKRRSRELNELSLERVKEHLKAVSTPRREVTQVLWEGMVRGPDGQEWLAGTTPEYLRVLVPGSKISEDLKRGHQSSIPVSSWGVDPKTWEGVLLAI